MYVDRANGIYGNDDIVYGVWTKIVLGGEPEQFTGEWHRSITLFTHDTTYSDAPTFGTRNGMYYHRSTRDSLFRMNGAPRPAWATSYVINWWPGGQLDFWGDYCSDGGLLQNALCTEVNDFVNGNSPNGIATITDMSVPMQSSFGVSIFNGRELSVGPH